MNPIWYQHYPKGVPHAINPDAYSSIAELLEKSCERYAERPAFSNMGKKISYAELWERSGHFAAYLQGIGLQKGDRVAIQLPNLLQFPIALFGALRAGMVAVNTNPLYTPREMRHQFKDSGAKAILILSNFADKLEEILPETDIQHVIITDVGDCLNPLKGAVINFALKYVKREVPATRLESTLFHTALDIGASRSFNPPPLRGEDTAFLQYTGGTTGVSKGAILTHRNIVSNMEQIFAWFGQQLTQGQELIMTPLPLYHIFSLTVNCLAFVKIGAEIALVTNPRDIPAFIREIEKIQPTAMSLVNTLALALLEKPEFKKLKLERLKVTVAGGMALQTTIARRWIETTHTSIVEGYGLTETSPVVTCNPIDGSARVGSIGMPLPSTEVRLMTEAGTEAVAGESGELQVRGPQVMKGYWNQTAETAGVFTADGWLKTGDIATVDADGFFKIVDRKKDMILVSGFNVYPNEVEDVIARHPGVLESAAVGIADPHSGEVVKLFVVKKDPRLTAEELKAFAQQSLTHYKLPRKIEFVRELPKNNVGKILRRELRDRATVSSS